MSQVCWHRGDGLLCPSDGLVVELSDALRAQFRLVAPSDNAFKLKFLSAGRRFPVLFQ